jgi:uncharacterized protein YcfL
LTNSIFCAILNASEFLRKEDNSMRTFVITALTLMLLTSCGSGVEQETKQSIEIAEKHKTSSDLKAEEEARNRAVMDTAAIYIVTQTSPLP